MRRLVWIVFVVLCLSALSVAIDCNSMVSDDANVFTGKTTDVTLAGQALVDQGADLRVISTSSQNLDVSEHNMELGCPSWQGPNGTRKSTLIVLMVAPKERKMGMFYGAAWHHALDGSWNRIKQDYMAPYFKTGDFAGGMIASEKQLTARLLASKDEATHPATVVNEAAKPTDLSGLWRVMGWLLALGFGVFVIVVVVIELRARQRKKDAVTKAQADATAARNTATNLITQKKQVVMTVNDQRIFEDINQQFVDFAGSYRGDPSQELTLAQYESMRDVYNSIAAQLRALGKAGWKDGVNVKMDSSPRPSTKKKTHKDESFKEPEPGRSVSTSTVDNSVHVTPIVIGNDFGGSRETPERIREPEPEPEPTRSYGGSSDYGSSDSGGGGSSDWSSSDSGGGGSSDFGSGGDSGGGGSDSF